MISILKRNKNFRLFWISSCISGIGDYVDDIAFAVLIYSVTESALITSYVFAIKMALSFVSMFTSSIVDRNNKKNILIISSLGQGLLLFFLLLVYVNEHISSIILIVFVTIQTIFSTFSTPAQNALLPLIISDDEAIDARASFVLFQQFLQIFAYIGSGALISLFGVCGVIIIDIFTFLFSTVILMHINYSEVIITNNKNIEFIKTVKEGFTFVFRSRIIVAILIITFLGNLIASPVDSLSVVYFSDYYSYRYSYSIFMASVACGAILGTWLLTKVKNKFNYDRLFAFGFAIGGFGILLMKFSNYLILPFISGFLYGISNGFVSIMNGVLIQINTPKDMMGRVFSAFRCVSYTSGPLGIVIIGILAEYYNLNELFSCLGFMLILLSLSPMILLKKRNSYQNI